MTITEPAPTLPRDRFGRPLVVPPGGTSPVPYTRCTTFVDCIEDKFNLQKWMQRQVAIGLAARDDLRLAVNAHRDDKRELDRICDAAKDAAESSAKATIGTALHSMTEQIDRGLEPANVPVEYAPDLAAYIAATEGLQHDYIEQFTVNDAYKIGGTPDRIVTVDGKRYIADLKTGTIEFGTLKIAMQLAVYARSKVYDIATGERSSHGADLDRGIIIHLPAGTGVCTLHWVDLNAGWNAVTIARRVREARTLKFADLTHPYGVPVEPSLDDQIEALTNGDAIRALWAAHESEWTDELTAHAKRRIKALASQSPDTFGVGSTQGEQA